jgi:alkylhydroperoxidase family enzyme
MGHSQMLLAVAGLKDDEVTKLTQKLSAEGLAFRFADKLTRDPAGLSEKDVKSLVATFGRNRAVDLIWYGSWCNYMTRVADAFQLPLERDNVFADGK